MADKADDYRVTWDEVKVRVEKWLKEKRGIDGNKKIPMGTINYAIDRVWDEIYDEIKEMICN